jgi:EmrB/QacA subfamily drug resistance transporter
MSSVPATAPATDGALTHKQILTILTGLMLGMFLAALDQMIVATAIRTIGDDLHGLSAQAWVTTAFLITSTIATPLYGKLSDIYGRKPLFMIAITIFITGSALCGLSQSMYMLAAFRAFQGIGAGGLFSLALAILGDLIAPRERARYQGYFMAVFATSSVLGPVIGGFFAGQQSILGITGWRWIFYINVPIGLIALVVVNRTLHVHHERRDHRIDWFGAAALIVGLVPLLIIAEQGRLWGWASPVAFACYLVGAAGLASFVYVESRMGDDALIPLRLFRRSQTFSVGSGQSFIIGVGMFGGLASIPLYLQIVKGASPTEAGLLILPMVAGIMAASIFSGQLTSRTGRYRIFPIIGSALLVIGMLLLSTISAHTPLWRTALYMVVFGAGLGLNMQTIVLAMQNAVPVRDMGVATSSVTFFRQVGGTLGTAVFLSILFSAAPTKIAERFRGAGIRPPSGAVDLNDTSNINTLPPVVKEPILAGFSDAMNVVFLVGACVLVVAFVLSLMMKEVPLRQMSGIEQARADAAAAAAAAAAADGQPATVPDGAAVGSNGRHAAGVGSDGGVSPPARPPGR